MTKPTKQTIDEYRKIIADAPKGATHELGGFFYQCHDGFIKEHFGGQWGLAKLPYGVHHLADIRNIVAQYDENQRLLELLSECYSVALQPKIIDLVRCGICVNYGGYGYEKAINEIHEPLIELRSKIGEVLNNE